MVGGGAPGLVSARLVSTPAGGGGTESPNMLFRRNFPRSTGDVRSGYEVVDKQRPLRQQSAALASIGQRHAPEPASVDAGNAVVARELLVDEGVVGVQKLEHAPIVAKRAADEELGFTLEGIHQREVVVRIPLGIDDHFGDAAQVQPLRGEIID